MTVPLLPEIPTINISPYLAAPSSASAAAVVAAIRAACTSTGFFQITGHGVPRALQDRVFDGMRAFFALPMADKLALDRMKQGRVGNRGYEIMGTQILDKDGKGAADLKEGFYCASDLPATHPLAKKYPQFVGPNNWPAPSVLPYSTFRDPMTEYYTTMISLTNSLFAIIAAGLPYGPHLFDHFLDNEPLASLRPLHYPPSPSAHIGAGAHTDFGALTLLLQDDHPGLQVFDAPSNSWIPVPPNPDAYVVNIGDMLHKWTKGEYRSTLHRVINAGTKDRYSVPFFFDGNLDCRLVPFDGSEVEGGAITVEEHMRERFATTYRKKED